MSLNLRSYVGLASLVIVCSTLVFAEDAQPEKAKSTETVKAKADPFAVPKDASPEKLVKFINDLMEMEPILLTEDAIKAHYEKVANAILQASEKVLSAEDLEINVAAQALDARFTALSLKSRLGDKNAGQQRLDLAKKYIADERKPLARMAQEQQLFGNMERFDDLKAAEQEKLLDDAVTFIKSIRKFDNRSIKLILTIGRVFEGSNVEGLSAKAYDQFSAALVHSPDGRGESLGENLAVMAKRMRLVGQPFEVEGKLTTKEPIDWASYRGKVVLVDFWATWCGPCVAELPNLKHIYQGFSSKGFDIVGISKDTDKKALDEFLTENEIAWANLFEDGAEDHPLAEKYGIMSIPYTVLVGKDGKVIKMNPTSAQLKEKLTELLGPPVTVEKKGTENESDEKSKEKSESK